MNHRGIALLLALAVCSGGACAEAVEPVASDYLYEVKPGDTLGKIARSQLDAPTRWRDVAAYNELPDPDRIEPGQTLRIRQPWLKGESGKLKVEAVSGSATAAGRALRPGDEIAVGTNVRTAAGGALRVRLPDGSVMNMMENGAFQVEKLERRPGNWFNALFKLISGQIETFKQKYPAGQAELAIRAKGAVLGVRGTHFRMRQEAVNTYAEIEQGLVSFDAQKTPAPLALNGGEGSVADGEHPAEVIPLLPAPQFPHLPEVFDAPYIRWLMPRMEGATAYVGELARDEEFSDHLLPVRGQGDSIRLPDLPNGRYWLRLRAVDGHGLQGMEGKIAFTVNVPPRKFAMTKVYVAGSSIQLRWVAGKESTGYQVQVADNQSFEHPVLDTRTSDNLVELPKPRAGAYFMRVRHLYAGGRGGEWDVPMMFEVPR